MASNPMQRQARNSFLLGNGININYSSNNSGFNVYANKKIK